MIGHENVVQLFAPQKGSPFQVWFFVGRRFEPITVANHFFWTCGDAWSKGTRRNYAYFLADFLRYCALVEIDPVNIPASELRR